MKNIVISGSTRGIGFALAERFLDDGERVIISSRSEAHLAEALEKLSDSGDRVAGITCDVTKQEDVARLADFAIDRFGSIDIWINNAGTSGARHVPLVEWTEAELRTVVETNLLGTMLGCGVALSKMLPAGVGMIFNMDGYGANGSATPELAPYGATKRAVPQLTKSLVKETAGSGVGVHTLSPGMVLTDLLLKGSDGRARKVFNILAERPETVADFLVRKIQAVPEGASGRYIRFLTGPKVFWRFLTAGFRKNRFFSESGQEERV